MAGVQGGRIAGTFFLSEERDIVLSGALLFPADIDVGIGALSILIGPQAYFALLDDENSDVMSLALGADLRLLLNRRLGLAVSGQAFYGPDILTFGSADNLTDLSARVEVNVAPRLAAFGGMRWFEFDLTEGAGERTLQEEVFVGVGYRF
ncbi:MAG: YfaZ family outer membrane protein [Steroidobacteraceae bacterium]